MRHKILIPVNVLVFLLVVSLSNPAFADSPGEGSHSSMHERMEKGGGDGYSGHDGHGKWGSHRRLGGHGYDPYNKVLMCQARLGLTADQIKEITDRQFEFKKQMIKTRADHELARLEFKKHLSAETLDEARLQNSATEVSAMISRQISAVMNAKIAVMKILTPEQRKKLLESHSDGD